MDDKESFYWDNETVITRGVRPTAVYLNPHGEVVIRQQGEYPQDGDDPFSYLPVEYAEKLVLRITEVIAEARASTPTA